MKNKKILIIVGLSLFVTSVTFNLVSAVHAATAPPEEIWNHYWHVKACPTDPDKTYTQCDSSGAYVKCSPCGAIKDDHCPPNPEPE